MHIRQLSRPLLKRAVQGWSIKITSECVQRRSMRVVQTSIYRDEVFRLRRLSIEGVRYELEYDRDPVRVCSTLAFLAGDVFAVTKT
jgi:hypothetical protein